MHTSLNLSIVSLLLLLPSLFHSLPLYIFAPASRLQLQQLPTLPSVNTKSTSQITVEAFPTEAVWYLTRSSIRSASATAETHYLPFTFPFYSTPYRSLVISSFGALLFANNNQAKVQLPCCTNSTQCELNTPTCNIDTQYYNVIVPLLTSFIPLNSSSIERIDWRVDEQPYRLTVLWSNMILQHNTSATTSQFAVQINEYGDIVFNYTSVSDLSAAKQLMIGLRGQQGVDVESAMESQYNLTQPGYYVNRSIIQAGSTISACQLDSSFCLFPASLSLNKTAPLYITSQLTSCWESRFNRSFACRFEDGVSVVEVSADYDEQLQVLRCIVSASSVEKSVNVSLVDENGEEVRMDRVLQFSYSARSPSTDIATLRQSLCQSCAASLPGAVCPFDCSGVSGGMGFLDYCNVCVNSTSEASNNMNCQGRCFTSINVSLSTQQCVCDSVPLTALNSSNTLNEQLIPTNPLYEFNNTSTAVRAIYNCNDGVNSSINAAFEPIVNYHTMLLSVAALGWAMSIVTTANSIRKRFWPAQHSEAAAPLFVEAQ